MAQPASPEKATKTAPAKANARTKKADTETKLKRRLSTNDMTEHIKVWKEKNPGKSIKEAMAVAEDVRRDALLNSKAGQAPAEPKTKKTKADKESDKENANKAPPKKAKAIETKTKKGGD